MNCFDHRWMLASRIAQLPLVWMITFNGFIVDVPTLPREIQEIGFE